MTNAEIKYRLKKFTMFSPEHIGKKFHVHEGNENEFYFSGFIFRNEEVIPYNLVMFNKYDKSENYINLKPTLLILLKYLNILHACLVLQALIDKYHREVKLVEDNILENLKHYDKRFKHKSTIHVTKHRSRERKFIASDKLRDDKRWNTLLISTFYEGCFINLLSEYKRQRPSSILMLYPSKYELVACENKHRQSIILQKRQNKRYD